MMVNDLNDLNDGQWPQFFKLVQNSRFKFKIEGSFFTIFSKKF